MGEFKLLFRVEVTHLFFADSLCRSLEFTPTAACGRLIEKSGIILKDSPNGFSAYYDSDKKDVLALYADDPHDPLHFCFKAFSLDPGFLNYTELPEDRRDSILYFDGRRVQKSDSPMARLSQGEYVSQKDYEALSEGFLKDIMTKRDLLLRPLFILFLDGTKMPESEPVTYAINFQSRKTRWKYYIIKGRKDGGLYIHDPREEIVFRESEKGALPGGGEAPAFISETPIPLREISPHAFQLKKKNSGNGKVLVKRLPVASPNQIYEESHSDTKITVSEIFINC